MDVRQKSLLLFDSGIKYEGKEHELNVDGVIFKAIIYDEVPIKQKGHAVYKIFIDRLMRDMKVGQCLATPLSYVVLVSCANRYKDTHEFEFRVLNNGWTGVWRTA